MGPVGFSTGALACADFREGLRMLQGKAVQAVELSALRQPEPTPLLAALPSLDLRTFDYVSIHAPSQCDPADERFIRDQLSAHVPPNWAVVLHPDAIVDFGLWRELGALVCIENMDKRKPTGRNAKELRQDFSATSQCNTVFRHWPRPPIRPDHD